MKESINDLESRHKAIIETAVDGIITIDERGVIELVNPAACKIFGYDAAELIGQPINMLMPTGDKENHDNYIGNYMRTNKARIIGTGREVIGQRKDGSVFPFWLAINEVKLENKRLFTGIVHDMSEQKRAESQLITLNRQLETKVAERTKRLTEAVEKLLEINHKLEFEIQERKNAEQALLLAQDELRFALKREQELGQLKSRFVSMASHEFRTPLSTILSSASLMSQYTLTEQQDKRERHFKKIKSAVESLTMILDDFLSVSRLEEGRVELNPTVFELKTICTEMIEEMQGVLKRGQRMLFNTTDDNLSISADRKVLKLILINLISNASKYSGEDKKIYCTITEGAQFVEIAISDEGIGIPEEDQVHLFDRFFRASNVVNIKGTGLGLHIVKRYADLMNGKISFLSIFGKGSTFTLFLPKMNN